MSGSTGTVRASHGGASDANSKEHGSGAGRATPADQWPFQSNLEFAPLKTAPSCARLHTKHVLIEWGLRELIDDAEYIVSELITNALQASWVLKDESLPIVLWLVADAHRLIIEAWDANPNEPQHRPLGDDAESGRGLTVIQALSHRWGVRRPSFNYKAVWCELLIKGN